MSQHTWQSLELMSRKVIRDSMLMDQAVEGLTGVLLLFTGDGFEERRHLNETGRDEGCTYQRYNQAGCAGQSLGG